MRGLRLLSRSLPLLLLVLSVACVTINVYFPAAAAERAADRIIDDVWGQSPGGGSPPPQSQPQSQRWSPVLPLAALVEFFLPTAHAQQADIDISSPAIDGLRQSMAARHRQLAPYYDSGAIGLTSDGLITVRDLNQVPLPQRGTVQQLVGAERQDRNALYQAIAVANNHPEWESKIRATFARRWIANAPGGWWYQQGGSWAQK